MGNSMSLAADGKTIICDGEGCTQAATALVGLRSTLTPNTQNPPTVDGWLFVASQGAWRHYCPKCAAKYVKSLSGRTKPGHPSLSPSASAEQPDEAVETKT